MLSNEMKIIKTKIFWKNTALVESLAELGDKTKVNQKIEEYEHEELDKMLQVFYAEIRLLKT